MIKKMKIELDALIIACLLFLTGVGSGQNIDGREILEKAVHRKKFSDSSLKVQIEKTKASITKKISLELFQRNYPEMIATLVVIEEPEPARGISFLTWDYLSPDRPDKKWYYLPAVNQYKELNDEQGKKYEDQFGFSMKIFAIDLTAAEHRLVGEEKVNGRNCWKVESLLKNPDLPDGAKIITWVGKDTFAAWKIQAFDKSGKMLREFNLLEEKRLGDSYQEISGVYLDFFKEQKLKFQITDAQFNTGLKDELFLSTKMKARAKDTSK